MVPFRGTFDHTLDAKNRLTMPARYRSALAGLPPLSRQLAELERFFYGSSQDSELDAAGRVIVPAFLIDHAQLQREIVIVGAGERLELWSRDGWNDHQSALMSGVADITAHVDDTA